MQIGKAEVVSIFGSVLTSVTEGADRLTELDSVLGDGDLGLTMQNGFRTICDFMAANEASLNLSSLIIQAGFAMAEKVPSTMGTLVSIGIVKAGKAAQGFESIDENVAGAMLKAAADGIAARGKAKRGEKTILDALYPASEAFSSAFEAGEDFAACSAAAAEVGEKAAVETSRLKSIYGKAAVYGEDSIGKQDPGATAAAIILKGISGWFSSTKH